MAFDVVAARAELAAVEAKIRSLEADGGDDEDVLDLWAEANELRDELRNHESYPSLWDSITASGPLAPGDPEAHGLQSERISEHCSALRGLLHPGEAEALLAAALQPPGLLAAHAGDPVSQRCGECFEGPIRRSDDFFLAQMLWERVSRHAPADVRNSIAPASQAGLRTELWPQFQWDADWRPCAVHSHVVYEQLDLLPEPSQRFDSTDMDDREDTGRPLVSLVIALGTISDGQPCGVSASDGTVAHISFSNEAGALAPEGAVELADGRATCGDGAPSSVNLCLGDAVLFKRGDSNYAYSLRSCAKDRRAVVAHASILYSFGDPGPGCARADAGSAATS